MTIEKRLGEFFASGKNFVAYVLNGRILGRLIEFEGDSCVFALKDGRFCHCRVSSITNLIYHQNDGDERLESREGADV